LLSAASAFQRSAAVGGKVATAKIATVVLTVLVAWSVLHSGDMSEAAAAEKAPAPAGGGSNKMLLLVVLVVNVLIAGGLGYVVITNQKNNAAAAAGAAKHEDGEGEGHEGAAEGEAEGEPEAAEGHGKKGGGSGKFGPLIDIGTFVANLTTAGGASRYAKVGLHVEATSEDAKAKIEVAVVPLRNEALLYLSGLQSDQVIGQERIKVLQDELLKRMTALVGKNVIKHVYFSEFVVQ
jgi:flagellar protein FliL